MDSQGVACTEAQSNGQHNLPAKAAKAAKAAAGKEQQRKKKDIEKEKQKEKKKKKNKKKKKTKDNNDEEDIWRDNGCNNNKITTAAIRHQQKWQRGPLRH